jgi:hypothetical protein
MCSCTNIRPLASSPQDATPHAYISVVAICLDVWHKSWPIIVLTYGSPEALRSAWVCANAETLMTIVHCESCRPARDIADSPKSPTSCQGPLYPSSFIFISSIYLLQYLAPCVLTTSCDTTDLLAESRVGLCLCLRLLYHFSGTLTFTTSRLYPAATCNTSNFFWIHFSRASNCFQSTFHRRHTTINPRNRHHAVFPRCNHRRTFIVLPRSEPRCRISLIDPQCFGRPRIQPHVILSNESV